jgi:ABC-type thiamine transport system substrate-binding protein
MVLSYTTSPAYHLIAEGDATKAAAAFDEGHYLQIEVAGCWRMRRNRTWPGPSWRSSPAMRFSR